MVYQGIGAGDSHNPADFDQRRKEYIGDRSQADLFILKGIFDHLRGGNLQEV